MKKKTAAVLFGGVIFLLIGGVYVFFRHESGTPESLSIGNIAGLSARQQSLLRQPALPADSEIAKLVVRKADREMDAYDAQGRLLKTYPVALGFNPVGHKQFEPRKAATSSTTAIPTAAIIKTSAFPIPTMPTAPMPPRRAKARAATSKYTA